MWLSSKFCALHAKGRLLNPHPLPTKGSQTAGDVKNYSLRSWSVISSRNEQF